MSPGRHIAIVAAVALAVAAIPAQVATIQISM